MWEIPHNLVIYSFNDQANIVTYVVKLLMLNWVWSLFNLSFKMAAKSYPPIASDSSSVQNLSPQVHNILLHPKSFLPNLLTHHTTLCQRRGFEAYTYLNATGSCFQQGLSSIPKTKVHLNIGTVIQNLEIGVTKTWIHLVCIA